MNKIQFIRVINTEKGCAPYSMTVICNTWYGLKKTKFIANQIEMKHKEYDSDRYNIVNDCLPCPPASFMRFTIHNLTNSQTNIIQLCILYLMKEKKPPNTSL